MVRGRPLGSEVRQNIIEILAATGPLYGYIIKKLYTEIFGKTTIENIYYHLKKGTDLGEIELKEVKQEKGDFSWGNTVEKKYYGLGANVFIRGDERVKEFFEKNSEAG